MAQWAPTLPDEAGTSVALLRPPHHPSLRPALHGRAVVHLRYTHVGRPAEAEALLAPLRAVATPLHDDVREARPARRGGPGRALALDLVELRAMGGALERPAAMRNVVAGRGAA